MNNTILASTALLLTVAAPAAAQNEQALKYAFEGRMVTLRMDMPGTKDGVNVYPGFRGSVDLDRYRYDLRHSGIAIRAGESAMVTLVKVKKDLIEFQLGGGGYGTFFDDTDTSVYVPLIGKSDRERYLERRLNEENDRGRLREVRRELNDLRDRRERENRRLRMEAERVSELKQERLAFRRLNGGSRFNLRFQGRVPFGLTPDDIVAALSEFVDFRDDATAAR